MKKIIIFYAKYGGGHLSAARSIKEVLETNYTGIDVELIDFMEYASKVFNKISTTAYSEMAKKAPHTWGRLYWHSQKGPLAQISTASNKILSIKLKRLLIEKEPDLIISTHPFASQMCGYLKKHKKIDIKVATILTDFASHEQWLVFNKYIDYFFVAHEGMRKELNQNGIPNEKIFVTGIPISSRFLKNYDRTAILKEFGLSSDKKTVLFFGGGEFGLGKTQTLNIFKAFVYSKYPIQIVAISGKNLRMEEAFKNLVEDTHKQDCVKIIEYTNQVPELMSITDLVVTKPGGLTISESLASYLPIIIINPIPGQEEENATYLTENKAAIWIKKDDNVEQILDNLFSSPDKLNDMKEHAKLISKRNSTFDICKILLGDSSKENS